ncbi:hypothetical protein BLNAU_24160 [Blattamonas nauphoetae]|uniref:Uncharacterized protein n=1 Tax=Blattamonas nauphoetae TaxID=2049346 RepID=A0ABQ9WN73_9EUKA|nr:hypothetical protein BLNAU_24160 [Blattamonas nauphoetae]
MHTARFSITTSPSTLPFPITTTVSVSSIASLRSLSVTPEHLLPHKGWSSRRFSLDTTIADPSRWYHSYRSENGLYPATPTFEAEFTATPRIGEDTLNVPTQLSECTAPSCEQSKGKGQMASHKHVLQLSAILALQRGHSIVGGGAVQIVAVRECHRRDPPVTEIRGDGITIGVDDDPESSPLMIPERLTWTDVLEG